MGGLKWKFLVTGVAMLMFGLASQSGLSFANEVESSVSTEADAREHDENVRSERLKKLEALDQERQNFDLEKAVEEAKTADAQDLEKNCPNEPWRREVRTELVDNASDSEVKGIKKLKVFGIPQGVDVSCVRIGGYDWGLTHSSSVFSSEHGSEENLKEKDLYFNESENCYEFNFSPGLDSKNLYCKNFVSPFEMKYFRYIIFLKNKETGEAIQPIDGFVSNEGLKKPSCLDEFKNFKIDYIKNDGNEQEGLLKIYGVPSNVEKIEVSVQEELDGKDKPWSRTLENTEIVRGDDGSFSFAYSPKRVSVDDEKQPGKKMLVASQKVLEIDFVDEEGYSYLITDVMDHVNFD